MIERVRPKPVIESMRIDELAPAPYNPRRISDDAKRGLAKSIERFGLVQPIVFNRRTGHVVGGHQRLDVLKADGVTETDVVVVDLPESEEKALNVALNSPAISGEFTDDLEDLLAEIQAIEPELFGELQLDKLLAGAFEPVPGKTDPDAVPEPPADPKSVYGELYVLGQHRLLCGDSTDADDVARLLGADKPRVLLTDPPYGVSLDMEWRDRAGKNALGPAEKSYMQRGEGHANTSISGDTKADWSDAFELVPSLDVAYVWHASAFAIEVGTGLRRIGFEIKQQIIWVKPQFALSRQHYHWQHEPCWYARKAGSAPFRGSRDQSTIWEAASPKMIMSGGGEEKVDHPTQKPAVLYTRPIENHLDLGACFYEPFGGSGTGIIAAETTRRRCLAIEIDPIFVDVIRKRWAEFVHGKACDWEALTPSDDAGASRRSAG